MVRRDGLGAGGGKWLLYCGVKISLKDYAELLGVVWLKNTETPLITCV